MLSQLFKTRVIRHLCKACLSKRGNAEWKQGEKRSAQLSVCVCLGQRWAS